MLRNRLLKLSLLSFFFHIGVFSFLTPIFYYPNREEIRRIFWGRFEYLGGFSTFKEKEIFGFSSYKNRALLNWSLEDFFFVSQHRLFTHFKKINKGFNFLKSPPLVKYPLLSMPKVKSSSLYYIAGKSKVEFRILDNISFFSEDIAKYLKPYKKKVKLRVFISPQGRIIWINGLNFSSDFQLSSVIEEKVRSLVFPSRGIYYWKNLEIMLK